MSKKYIGLILLFLTSFGVSAQDGYINNSGTDSGIKERIKERLIEKIKEKKESSEARGEEKKDGFRMPDVNADTAMAKLAKEKRSKIFINDPRFTTIKDLEYGQHPREKLDIYLPKNFSDKRPLLFYVHGGGWSNGDKDLENMIKEKVPYYTQKGFVFVSIAYPLLPDPVSIQAESVHKAFNYVRDNAQKFNIDTNKMVLMGHSAGAHLVSLVGTKGGLGNSPVKANLIISLDSGALDVHAQMKAVGNISLWKNAFGVDKEYWTAVSPYHHFSSSSVPFFIVCDQKRKESCQQAESIKNLGQKYSVNVEVLQISNKNHGTINGDVGKDLEYTKKIDDAIEKSFN